MKTINASGSALTYHLPLVAMAASELVWATSVAQQVSLANLALYSEVTVKRERSMDTETFSVPVVHDTFGGIPITLDNNLTPGMIELRRGTEVLVRIENLAIPVFL